MTAAAEEGNRRKGVLSYGRFLDGRQQRSQPHGAHPDCDGSKQGDAEQLRFRIAPPGESGESDTGAHDQHGNGDVSPRLDATPDKAHRRSEDADENGGRPWRHRLAGRRRHGRGRKRRAPQDRVRRPSQLEAPANARRKVTNSDKSESHTRTPRAPRTFRHTSRTADCSRNAAPSLEQCRHHRVEAT